MKTLHVVAEPVAAGTLRAALARAGIDEQVLSFRDPLSVGPLDDVDATGARRAAFWLLIDAAQDWGELRSERGAHVVGIAHNDRAGRRVARPPPDGAAVAASDRCAAPHVGRRAT